MVNTIWTKENGLSYLMRYWLVMEPSSLYFKVVLAVCYLRMLLSLFYYSFCYLLYKFIWMNYGLPSFGCCEVNTFSFSFVQL